MSPKHIAIYALLSGAILTPVWKTLHAQTPDTPPAVAAPQAATTAGKKQQPLAIKAQQQQDDGQHVFEQNCARCHTAPEGFSPRISGTIVRHMRVRASLSQEDEQKLLRFLNP